MLPQLKQYILESLNTIIHKRKYYSFCFFLYFVYDHSKEHDLKVALHKLGASVSPTMGHSTNAIIIESAILEELN